MLVQPEVPGDAGASIDPDPRLGIAVQQEAPPSRGAADDGVLKIRAHRPGAGR
jgi:hypothetical protein